MSQGIYDAVSSMAVSERRLEVISQNLANASSVGYKRQTGAVQSFEQVLGGRHLTGQALITENDFTQGSLEDTGNAYDVAFLGDGFLGIESEDGIAWSRGGTLRTLSDGTLVSKEGAPLVWESTPAELDLNLEPPRIDARGRVFQAGAELGQLRLVSFEDTSRLTLDGNGYWHAGAADTPEPATGELIQGALETSNVDPVAEVVEMILAQRAYQASANVVTQIAESYSRLARSG